MRRTNLYTVRTRDGFRFQIGASSYSQAEQRAMDPVIAKTIARMMSEAISKVTSVESAKNERLGLVFREDLFKPDPGEPLSYPWGDTR